VDVDLSSSMLGSGSGGSFCSWMNEMRPWSYILVALELHDQQELE